MADRSHPRGRTTPKDPPRTTEMATRRSLHDDVTAELRTLGIALTPAALDAALSAAERESLSHLEFLHRLLAEPAEARRQRALDRRLRAAKFRELTTLEGFDWEFNAKGVDRRTVEQLATCDFVRRRENVILVGQTGLGKSRILQAIGRGRMCPGLPRPLCDQCQAAPGTHRGFGRRVVYPDARCLRSVGPLAD